MKAKLFIVLLVSINMVSCKSNLNEPISKPNILWITIEDISPHLGCYGDKYAYTPTLDKLAGEGVLFSNAYASASVCTPARSSIITGMYASSLGTQHLRNKTPLSKNIRCFTEYLREDGYHCSNFNKTDYNFDTPTGAWDVNGKITFDSLVNGHLKKIPGNRPFFSVFNIFNTHQSQTRYDAEELDKRNAFLPLEAQHNPDLVPVPPYYPNTPQVRTNLAALHTQITLMDTQVKVILDQLEESGLLEHTIVFVYSDHGDGLPRHKRWLNSSGIKVPLIIRFPKEYEFLSPVPAGKIDSSIVNFVDLAPTMLSLAGIEIPEPLPGNVFLGPNRTQRKYSFAIRDRVDEVYEFSRSVSSEKYQYIRNFAHDKPRMQWSNYSEITPIRKELRRLHKEGQLTRENKWLMRDQKPIEELYDLEKDPYQMNNLAQNQKFIPLLKEMKNTLFEWMIKNQDLSLIPEPLMRRKSGENSPFDIWSNTEEFPIQNILAIADLKGRGEMHIEKLKKGLSNPSPIIRFWSASGLASLENQSHRDVPKLKELLDDDNDEVRIVVADALLKKGEYKEAMEVLGHALMHDEILVRLYAAITILDNKEHAYMIAEMIQKSKEKPAANNLDQNLANYLNDALGRITENL